MACSNPQKTQPIGPTGSAGCPDAHIAIRSCVGVASPRRNAAKPRGRCPQRLPPPARQQHRRRKQKNAFRIPRVTPGKARQGHTLRQLAFVLPRYGPLLLAKGRGLLLISSLCSVPLPNFLTI